MQEELPEHAIVSSNEQCVVKGSVIVENSTDTHIGPKYIFVYPSADKEIELRPELLDINGVNKTPFQDKTDKNNEVCIVEESKLRIRKLYVLIGGIVIAIISTVAILAAVYATPQTDPEPDNNNDSLSIIRRGEWFAENSTEEILKLKKFPAPYIIVAHTAGNECNTTNACKSQVRNIQAYHISLDYGDIGYNFLVGGDGNIYEGLGWNAHGAHTIPFNSRSIGLAFIGNFVHKTPPRKQLKAAHLLLEEGLRTQKLTRYYKVFGQSQIIATDSPGAKLMEIIQNSWAHWSIYDSSIDGYEKFKKDNP